MLRYWYAKKGVREQELTLFDCFFVQRVERNGAEGQRVVEPHHRKYFSSPHIDAVGTSAVMVT